MASVHEAVKKAESLFQEMVKKLTKTSLINTTDLSNELNMNFLNHDIGEDSVNKKNSAQILPDPRVCTRVFVNNLKLILLTNGISERLFVEKVLKIDAKNSWGIFKQPKSWRKCSEKEKQQWLRMYEWSQSAQAIQSLHEFGYFNKENNCKFSVFKNQFSVSDLSIELDTALITRRVNEILKRECISFIVFASEVAKKSDTQLAKFLRNPIPWSECTAARKIFYSKLHKWLESTEAIQSTIEANKSKSRRRAFVSNFKNLPDVSSDLELDTRKVAKRVKEILLTEGISQKLFARSVLSLRSNHYDSLLNGPRPWSECSEYKKKVFFRMHLWSQSPQEIMTLKLKKTQ
jgi:hypothetical protein